MLIWLYLGVVNNEIALIANFFEVNATYAKDDYMRISLLQGLLKFTEQYLIDNPGIKKFYMNQLSYGWNMQDLNQFPLVKVEIEDKVGGAFMPSYEKEIPTSECYYLNSLHKHEFYEYTPIELNEKIQISWSDEIEPTHENFKLNLISST